MVVAKLLGKRTHQLPGQHSAAALHHAHDPNLLSGRLNVSELFFEVPKDYGNASKGTIRLFARSVERFEKPVDTSKQDVKQHPWCM